MSFGASVGKTATKMKQQLNNKVLGIATDMFNTTVKLTPVNQLMLWRGKPSNRGELINNWYVGYGKGNTNKAYSYAAADATGNGSYTRIKRVKTTLEFFGKDSEVSLTNSTPYALRAEYIGWPAPKWSNNAPYFMVRTALLRTSAKLKV